MDFEKTALELRDHLERNSEGSAIISDFCLPDIAKALLRAHRQGQEEMRERAAKAASLLNGWGSGKVAELANIVVADIRSLPLTPIQEKSSPEFLPKASTKEVGIK